MIFSNLPTAIVFEIQCDWLTLDALASIDIAGCRKAGSSVSSGVIISQDFPVVPRGLLRWLCHRGLYLKVISLAVDLREEAQFLACQTKLKTLRIHVSKTLPLTGLLRDSTEIEDLHLEGLRQFPSEWVENFEPLASLKKLTLTKCALDSRNKESYKTFFKNSSNLDTVIISRCNLTKCMGGMLKSLGSKVKVSILDCVNEQEQEEVEEDEDCYYHKLITAAGGRIKHFSISCENSREIEVNMDPMMSALAEKGKNLRSLRLRMCNEIPADQLISTVLKCVKLEHLCVTDFPFAQPDIEQLLNSPIGRQLKSLNISCTLEDGMYANRDIGDQVVDTVIQHCPALRCINLGALDNISASAIHRLVQRYGQQLCELGIARCGAPAGLTDETLQLIAEKCPNLEKLEVSHQSGVTDAGIAIILHKCKHLKWLDFAHCSKVTPAAFRDATYPVRCYLLFVNVNCCVKFTKDAILSLHRQRIEVYSDYRTLLAPKRGVMDADWQDYATGQVVTPAAVHQHMAQLSYA